MANTTKAPSGIAITRSSEKLIIKWKQKDNYNSQQLQYKLNTGSTKDAWKSVSIGAGTTSKTISIERDKYHPIKNKTLAGVSFRVRGKVSNKNWSAWTKKVYNITVPNKPSISVAQDGTVANKITFSWSVNAANTSTHVFTRFGYKTALTEGNAAPNWDKISATYKATDTASGTISFTEDTSVIATGSHTRHVRCWAEGPQGKSGMVDSKFVFALPNQTKNVMPEVFEDADGGTNITVSWSTKIDKGHPVDKTTVQYAMVVPNAGLTCPSGASWNDASITKDIADGKTTTATSKAQFSVDDVLDTDECLFIRVNTQHAEETNINYGEPVLAKIGNLADPSGLVISDINPTTHRVTLTAENNSDVEDAKLAIIYRSSSKPDEAFIIAVLPYNNSYTKIIQCPDWGSDAIAFGVYAFVGDVTTIVRADDVTAYAITERMRSAETIWEGGSVPLAPSGVDVKPTEIAGTIRVSWNWDWEDADSAVLSWADHDDAWESTAEPEEFTISKMHASVWNISGLETGKKWYVRVRLTKGSGDDVTYGPWSKMESIDLSSAPSVPTLVLSNDVITVDGTVTASWAYSSTDATAQAYAKICEVEITENGIVYGEELAHTETAQHVDISAEGWQAGETHYLCLNVMSASGKWSDAWSDPVSIKIAEPLSCEITETSLEEVTEEIDGTVFEFLALTELPMTVTVSGAGVGGITTLIIERAEDYHMTRPDESEFNGYEGETIYLKSFPGEAQAEIVLSDLIGTLDDEASYNLIATVKDNYGQSASAQMGFVVDWSHQAMMPTATVVIDGMIAKITVPEPEDVVTGDTFEIYRLSADKPELIVQDGVWGTTYVDPYPTLGNYGYRICFRSLYGDYITEDSKPAWVDVETDFNPEGIRSIIDFDGRQILLTRNVDLGFSWEKDFQETRYLGGSVQGDWNVAVGRSGSVNTTAITFADENVIANIRRLAAYTGICHIRTFDGTSMACDIQISDDRSHDSYGSLAEFSMTVTKVDPEDLDGLTFTEWSE